MKIPIMAEQDVRKLLKGGSVKVRERDNHIIIDITNSSGFVQFKDKSFLQGLIALAALFDCDEADIISQYKSDGCPTCDFGSTYETTLKLWSK